ncbi:hypothetical protein E6C27_scaffold7389G00050 [Cucumis melo var. makuwa]|uniref:Uncharacterized protein n=1 Tax=Cucumis melo var. makuwa TaxID=1194695 RepID=A0A5A7VHT7_CUCMM|nr:hypothetical protein E6C27_scaffold7389G00050 [Cucumis melo var. makuwa]
MAVLSCRRRQIFLEGQAASSRTRLSNNRSVMPLDVLGRTRATMKVSACPPWPKGPGNPLKHLRAWDWGLKLFPMNEEFPVLARSSLLLGADVLSPTGLPDRTTEQMTGRWPKTGRPDEVSVSDAKHPTEVRTPRSTSALISECGRRLLCRARLESPRASVVLLKSSGWSLHRFPPSRRSAKSGGCVTFLVLGLDVAPPVLKTWRYALQRATAQFAFYFLALCVSPPRDSPFTTSVQRLGGPVNTATRSLVQVQLEWGHTEGDRPVEQERLSCGSLLRVGLLESADLSEKNFEERVQEYVKLKWCKRTSSKSPNGEIQAYRAGGPRVQMASSARASVRVIRRHSSWGYLSGAVGCTSRLVGRRDPLGCSVHWPLVEPAPERGLVPRCCLHGPGVT